MIEYFNAEIEPLNRRLTELLEAEAMLLSLEDTTNEQA